MQKLPLAIGVGDRVRVRRQCWRVLDVRAFETCQLLTLAGLGPFNLGTESSVLFPFDRIEPLERRPRVRIVRPRQWRRRCRSLLAADSPPGGLVTALGSHIELLPHQLEPALAVVRGLGSRVLLADEVGLGKTIQAGLIIAELRARGAADRVLVITPAGLREQWSSELTTRFGLDFAIADMHDTRRRAAFLPIGLNPWATTPAVITSVDYVKRPEVFPLVYSCRWDVVVVDEVHGVTFGSERYRAISRLCRNAPHLVLLTATPHNGDRAQFESLCGLGSIGDDALLVFRRDRSEVSLGAGRRIHRVSVEATAAEREMYELLARFAAAVRADRGDGDRDAWLALATLHKRAWSSARSLQESVQRRLAGLRVGEDVPGHQLALPLDDGGGELEGSDETPAWSTPALDDPDSERRLLKALCAAAERAAVQESKLRLLTRLLVRLRRRGERAIVFTEYRDTLTHVRSSLLMSCAVLHGGLNRGERRNALEAFQSGRMPILLSTDAGGEGLNLHQECRVVINLELPWNPMRLEQRIGRVDRIGQERRVHAFNLIARDTGEMRVLNRLKARIASAQHDIGAADPLRTPFDDPDHQVARLMIAGDDAVRTPELQAPPATNRVFPALAPEAATERTRLLEVRRIWSAGRAPGLEVIDDTWLALARKPLTRARLGANVLVILQSVAADGCGHLVASHMTPLLLGTARHMDRADVNAFRAGLRQWCIENRFADSACLEWQEATSRFHSTFWSARQHRECAIAAELSRDEADVFQPGLFDARTVRERRARSEERGARIEAAVRDIARSEQAAIVQFHAARPALVLVP